ncbi:hypothetical protein ES703_24609 [subsurface metagenome]
MILCIGTSSALVKSTFIWKEWVLPRVPDGREGKLISSALVGEAYHNEVPIAITKIRAIATLAKFLYLILGVTALDRVLKSSNR